MSKTEQICREYASGRVGYYETMEALRFANPGMSGDALLHVLSTAKETVRQLDEERKSA